MAYTWKHGHAQRAKTGEPAPEYVAWQSMKSRCNLPSFVGYANYGGRGIKYCDRWENFAAFYEDMGPRPAKGYSLDRIDSNGNYEPSNCRWATAKQQQRNTRKTKFLTFSGKTLCISEWAEIYGLKSITIHCRLYRGWDVERSITTPRLNRGRAPK